MSEENQAQTESQNNNGKVNIGMVIVIIVLAIIAVLLIVVVADLATTDDSESGGQPIEGVPSPVPGEPQVTALTNVNVRAGPGMQYDVYGVMQEGQTARVVAVCSDHSWWAIEIPVQTGHGWVSADYVRAENVEDVQIVECYADSGPVPTPAPGQPSVTATALLNVRSGPGTQYPSYGLLQPGQSALAVGTNADGTWYAIDVPPAPDGIGWVAAEYVTTENVEGLPVIEAP